VQRAALAHSCLFPLGEHLLEWVTDGVPSVLAVPAPGKESIVVRLLVSDVGHHGQVDACLVEVFRGRRNDRWTA
jgi:hypothetical protein